jgi:cation diffusion facilitator family transporter
MRLSRNFEYPESLSKKFTKAKKIEWITFFYFISTSILMFLVMGNSQAMKTAWTEEILSLIPPVCFLISSRIYVLPPNQNFPYGYHKVISIAYLISSVALFAVGTFVFMDSAMKMIKLEHPTINNVDIFGKQVWLGYLMLFVLVYSTVPSMILGKIKKPISKELFEKNLFTDSEMNKADWMTGIAGAVGVTGIGLGLWWTDAIAALVISFSILKDGISNLKQSVLDLMNQVPKLVESQKTDPLFARIKKEIEKEDWVKKAEVRFRQEGHVYFGEAFIIPSRETQLTENIEELRKKILNINWRIFDLTITVVRNL